MSCGEEGVGWRERELGGQARGLLLCELGPYFSRLVARKLRTRKRDSTTRVELSAPSKKEPQFDLQKINLELSCNLLEMIETAEEELKSCF
jgi:hypothetical protein